MNARPQLIMKVAEEAPIATGEGELKGGAIVAFLLLVVLPAEAGQRRDQSTSPPVICDNDVHCNNFFNASSASVANNPTTRRKIYARNQ